MLTPGLLTGAQRGEGRGGRHVTDDRPLTTVIARILEVAKHSTRNEEQ